MNEAHLGNININKLICSQLIDCCVVLFLACWCVITPKKNNKKNNAPLSEQISKCCLAGARLNSIIHSRCFYAKGVPSSCFGLKETLGTEKNLVECNSHVDKHSSNCGRVTTSQCGGTKTGANPIHAQWLAWLSFSSYYMWPQFFPCRG